MVLLIPQCSLTEYPSYWGEHPELFAACSEGKDDVEQMVNVARWFIGTLKGQYMSRNTSMGSEKKVGSMSQIFDFLFDHVLTQRFRDTSLSTRSLARPSWAHGLTRIAEARQS